jgi:membrane protein
MVINKDSSIIKESIARFFNNGIAGRAAELAYFFLLSLFPFLIFLMSLIGYFPLTETDVLRFFEEFAPEDVNQMIARTLPPMLNHHNGGLLSLGLLATLWSASNGINAIVRALNDAYDVKESRSFLVGRLVAIILTIAMVFVIIIALLLPVFGREIGYLLFSAFGFSEYFFQVWNAIRWVVSGCILFIVFSALYYFAPSKHLHIKGILPGALLATLGWILVSLAFSYYVSNFGNYSATYGSIGAIIVLMIWFYLSGMIIVIGGELNAMLYKVKSNH